MQRPQNKTSQVIQKEEWLEDEIRVNGEIKTMCTLYKPM